MKIYESRLAISSLILASFFIVGCKDQTVSPSPQPETQTEIISEENIFTEEITTTQTQTFEISTQERTEKGFIINKKVIAWKGKTYTFNHYCDGTIRKGVEPEINYCIGKNALIFTDEEGKNTEITNIIINDEKEAPMLVDVYLVPSKINKGLALIAYSGEACNTNEECGAGMATNYVTLAFNLETKGSWDLNNYPSNGQAFWNNDGSKAVFIPETCGGAGCSMEALITYDLATDKVKHGATKEIAAGSIQNPDQIKTDSEGTKIPSWKEVTWMNGDSFKATIVKPDGTGQTVDGKF